MGGFLSGLGGSDDEGFDAYEAFVPEHLPEPGPYLAEHDVLVGREHALVHRLVRMLFEERGVYDMTFGYNLARLNLDQRHPEAGYRYARDSEDPDVLWAEFTPTTEFCPQSDTLTIGSFRALNGERDRHQFEMVKVRVDDTHQESTAINEKLRQIEETFAETGKMPGEDGTESDQSEDAQTDAPF